MSDTRTASVDSLSALIKMEGVSLGASIFSTTVVIDFILGGCLAENSRSCSVECEHHTLLYRPTACWVKLTLRSSLNRRQRDRGCYTAANSDWQLCHGRCIVSSVELLREDMFLSFHGWIITLVPVLVLFLFKHLFAFWIGCNYPRFILTATETAGDKKF